MTTGGIDHLASLIVVTLPDWLSPLPDAEQMRAVDRWAIEIRGVPGLDLMERAGAGVARAAERLAPDGPLTVVCGKGNNGGDGLVAARVLREAGRTVTVVSVVAPQELSGDARANLERLPGEAPVRLNGVPWSQEGDGRGAAQGKEGGGDTTFQAAAIVDALLGTGFGGEPRGAVAEAIEMINYAGREVLSVDVPSGV
ncbi:MAG: carbohydrate kinase, YjeF related protein, partial [Solirubrobacterales bacterium]|nr:carbohydrate kinase, YjeF related protein [Solirubrobacterales bacterium]